MKIDSLLSNTDLLINHVYWFEQDFKIKPSKNHIGCAINFSDIKERKDDFLRELVSTVINWVYSKEKVKKIIDDRLSLTGNDYGNASAFLTLQANSKFRPGKPQGQFGELLLFNFIQHFFKAAPLLRKQAITTSIGHERFGADAIHYKSKDSENIFILGESKCYKSDYQFKNAFETSLSSIINTFSSFDEEMDLYTYDDFISPQLQEIAASYKNGDLSNVHFELVCLIAYSENRSRTGNNEEEIKESIKNVIQERCDDLGNDCFSKIETNVLSRINHIIFPIWKLDELLEKFQIKVSSI